MKKITFFILVCFTVGGLYAQSFVIEGKVLDAKTGETVPGVAVYLHGTTIITVTDGEGSFRLPVEQIINTSLVFSHLSYDPLVIEPPLNPLPKEFLLREKVNAIAAAMVVADRVSREEKMEMFREHFLGKSMAGKSCIILNEEDVRLHYDAKTDQLFASAENPIMVENKYLAYLVTFDLHEFSIQYKENPFGGYNPTRVTSIGTFSFTDLNPYDLRIATRRNELYPRSPIFFWKNLVTNTLNETKFKVFHRGKIIDVNQFFALSDSLPPYKVVLKPLSNPIRRYQGVNEAVYGALRIVFNNKIDSEVVFLTHSFSIDEFGQIDSIDKILYYGDMGGQRLGDLLPLNFK